MSSDPPIRTLVDLCAARAETHGGLRAVDDGTLELTHAGLWERTRATAAHLRGHGVRQGDRLLLVARNSTGWVLAAFGALALGATVVPLGRGATVADKRRAVERLAPTLVVADPDLWGPDDPQLPRLDVADLASLPPAAGATLPTVDPDAVAVVLSSSGTTGAVKYVPMTHAQLVRMYTGMAEVLGLRADDLLLGAVPMAHSFGFNGVLLTAMAAGAGVRLVGEYDAADFPELVAEAGLTVLAGPPTIYHDLEVSGFRTPKVRLAITGSTEVQAARMRQICDDLGIPELVAGYGMTETCGSVAVGRIPRDPGPVPWMEPLEGVEVRVVDALSDVAPAPGVAGRLLVRGYNVQRHYADTLEQIVDPSGWLDTGDLALLDDKGRVAIVSRAKDTVIVSGFNVVPQDVEQVLAEHPLVARVLVVGVPDARRGERLVACVVPYGEAPDPQELAAHVRGQLPAYKVPSEFRFVTRFPTTANGKVSRADVRRSLMVPED